MCRTGMLLPKRATEAAINRLAAAATAGGSESRAHRFCTLVPEILRKDVEALFLELMQIAADSAQLVVCSKISARDRGAVAGSWPIEICPSAQLGEQHSNDDERDYLKGHEHVTCFGSRGSFLIFDARTWHRAGRAHIADWEAAAPSRAILHFIVHPESMQLTYTDTIRNGRRSI
jgi:hypothetical protein